MALRNPLRVFITGGAGFIGSNLAGHCLSLGWRVTAYDDLSLGQQRYLKPCLGHKRFRFIRANLLSGSALKKAIGGHDLVFHMAANSDIQRGTLRTDTDLKLGTLATYQVLEAMRLHKVGQIVFASTSAIYGEGVKKPTPENAGPLLPISLYGAGKLACEALISAYSHLYGIQAWVFRFANVVGKNGTHGAIVDFIRKLRKDPRALTVLGDGKQSKPYLHVEDCIAGMLFGWRNARESLNVFNLTSADPMDVDSMAREVIKKMGLKKARLRHTPGARGWPGDVPQVDLDGRKMAALGWRPSLNSRQAVERAIDELVRQFY